MCVKKFYKRWGKVKFGPGSPKAACRSSLQTTLRCCVLRDVVLSGKEKASIDLSGICCEDERKRTTDEASKQIVCIKTSVCEERWDKYSGCLFTGYTVHGVKVA